MLSLNNYFVKKEFFEVKGDKMSENSNMLLGVKDKPPAVNWILLAIQHVCAMFGATILVPIVVNTTVGSKDVCINTCSSCHLWYRYSHLHCMY